MNRKAKGSGFKMRSENKTSFKEMGGSPLNKFIFPAQVGLEDVIPGSHQPDLTVYGRDKPGDDDTFVITDDDGVPQWKKDAWKKKRAEEDANNQLDNILTAEKLSSGLSPQMDTPDYDWDEGSGSLYDYSINRSSAIQKRAPKGKQGFKMKRNKNK